MNTVLWIGQGLLATLFLISGVLKSTQTVDQMIATGQTAAKIVPLPYLRVAGVSELFGVLGLVLPWWTGIARALTPVAAIGVMILMVLAARVHARLGERRNIAGNMVILTVAALVAAGRFAGL